MRATAVVIPVPVMEPIVLPRLRRSLPGHVLSGPSEVNAHVTLLGPFAEPTPVLLGELAEFFARVEPFAFTVGGLYVYENMWVSLRPDPAEPFLELTSELWRRYPAHPPHGGRQSEIRPHLTVEYRLDQTTLESVEAEVARVAPVRATARMACLNLYGDLGSQVVASFPFRGEIV